MPKRIKRPLVKPLERREWLRRLEEEGQSVSELAKVVGYDVRTVKKQIEMAHQEHESREARFFVLRQALEKHYADLLSFAEKLDSERIQSALPVGIKSDRMWAALHEHMPRSPLWKLIDKMERLNDEERDIENRAEKRLWDEVRKENSFPVLSQPGGLEPGLYEKGMLGAMNYQLYQYPPCSLLDITTSSISDALIALNYAGCTCAAVHISQIDKAKGFITNLMAEVCQWPEREELQKTLSERTKVNAAISEELATIILKRVIPGHCKYCPV
jgi:uncharacterized protein (UPF0335 family)